MIDKTSVGKRIVELRKKHGYSQNDFADKLNITAQAVSKWETGQALPDIEILYTISELFKISIDEILEEKNILRKIANRPFAMSDIADFIPNEERTYDKEWFIGEDGNRANRNWQWYKNNKETHTEIAKEIVRYGGTVLEIGAGYAGGDYIIPVLFEKYNSEIIVSDLMVDNVRKWKCLLDKNFNPPNVYYAALDMCDMPFNDDSINVISSGDSFDPYAAKALSKVLSELYRVLKPGGLFVISGVAVTSDSLYFVSEDAKKELLNEVNIDGNLELFKKAGFTLKNDFLRDSWSSRRGAWGYSDAIADILNKYDAEIRFYKFLRYFTK